MKAHRAMIVVFLLYLENKTSDFQYARKRKQMPSTTPVMVRSTLSFAS